MKQKLQAANHLLASLRDEGRNSSRPRDDNLSNQHAASTLKAK